jgi:uncharacterized protein (TIRG00374 family)
LKLFSRILLSLVVTGVLLTLLFQWSNLSADELFESWKALPIGVYLQAVGVHFGIYVLRAARFRVLLPPGQRPSLPALLAVSASHNLAAYVLPAKTGEGTLVLYLRKVCGIAAGEGLATLVVSRLLDLAMLSSLLAAATMLLAQNGTLDGAWVWPLGILLAISGATLFVLSARSAWLVQVLTFLVRLVRLDATKLGARLEESAERIAGALRESGGQGRLAIASCLSLFLWLGIFFFYMILARGFGLGADLGPVEATFASSWASVANLVPINGFAGAGTQELGWAFGFTEVGVQEALAVSSGLGVHLVQLGNVVLFGIIGHVAMALIPSDE